jgi:RNA polymerase sigma factor (TIGR02999 family)
VDETTTTCRQAASGDEAVSFEEIYDQLRGIARRERRRNPSQTLDTTVLVHEAWLKLEKGRTRISGERQRLATYALAIRQLLVDYARARASAKRTPNEGYTAFVLEQAGERSADELLAIDEALRQLEDVDPRLVRLVELRFFTGLTLDESADALDISRRTAVRDWSRARAFLQASLQ